MYLGGLKPFDFTHEILISFQNSLHGANEKRFFIRYILDELTFNKIPHHQFELPSMLFVSRNNSLKSICYHIE